MGIELLSELLRIYCGIKIYWINILYVNFKRMNYEYLCHKIKKSKWYEMGFAIPSEGLRAKHSFAEDLSDFLAFRVGRIIDNRDIYEGNDEWSNMIWDVVRITQDALSRRKGSQRDSFSRQNRYNSDNCFFYGDRNSLGYRLYQAVDRAQDAERVYDNDSLQGGGMPIILIESGNISGENYLEY